MISTHENREEKNREKRKVKSVLLLLLEFLLLRFIDSCRRQGKGTRFTLLDYPFLPYPSLLIHQLAISRRRHGIRQCSHGRNAIQMPFPCRFFAHREGEGVQRSGAEVVANCGTDPRTRPAGNGEELSRMDESSPRVARFPGPGQAVWYSCPRVVHDRVHVDRRAKRRFRGSRPRKPPINRPLARPRRWNSSANEFVGSTG